MYLLHGFPLRDAEKRETVEQMRWEKSTFFDRILQIAIPYAGTSITDRSPENLEKYESVDRCLENPITEILDGGEKNKVMQLLFLRRLRGPLCSCGSESATIIHPDCWLQYINKIKIISRLLSVWMEPKQKERSETKVCPRINCRSAEFYAQNPNLKSPHKKINPHTLLCIKICRFEAAQC
ncbi:hypothetical protein HUJ05_008291 [Dendroctonus ponderosae]|nr:hypothetical protein HUJ05_008291 [Dendroctonus ponderosae]